MTESPQAKPRSRLEFFSLIAHAVIVVLVGCSIPRMISRFFTPPEQRGFYVAYEGGRCSEGKKGERFGANAYVIGPNTLMTAAHLVIKEGRKKNPADLITMPVKIKRGGACFDTVITAVDYANDLLFLAAPVDDPPFPVADDGPYAGQIVTSRGYEYIGPGIDNYRFLYHSGVVKNVTRKDCKAGRSSNRFEVHERGPGQGIFPGGTSGSAFFDDRGRVVGLLIRSDRATYAVAVSADTIKEAVRATYECLAIPCFVTAKCD
ncbi:trypsin-like peptidase domain-containing protein [Candidatus Uhrbacteria bacterium]|nr:trypsin-like peptidase domain-containing protein [Candidatus Uhrbacteria bacterium]